MTTPPDFGNFSGPKHRSAKPSRWWHFLRRNKLTEPKAKASLRAENQINLGKAYWDIPARLAFGGAVMVATWAMAKYVGALPLNGVEVSQHLTAIAAQLQGIPGGKPLTEAIGYLAQTGPLTVGAVAASYAGDRYKSGRKARLEQAKNLAEQQKRAEQRQRGVDVDTDPYEQIHALKQENTGLQTQVSNLQDENSGLRAQVSELQQFKAYAEAQFATINQSLHHAYGAHVATNQRIDNLERQPIPWSRPDDDDPGIGPDGPHPPDPPGGGVAVKPPPPPPPTPSQMLSRETSQQARSLLARAQKAKQAQESSAAERPASTTVRRPGTTPYQSPNPTRRPRQ